MINLLWVATLFCWSMKIKRAHHVGHVAQVLRLWNLHVANAIPGSHPGSSVADVGVKTVESPNWANTTASPKVLATQTHFYQVSRVCFLSRISSFPNFSACHTNHFDVHIPCVQRGAINMWQRNLQQRRPHQNWKWLIEHYCSTFHEGCLAT